MPTVNLTATFDDAKLIESIAFRFIRLVNRAARQENLLRGPNYTSALSLRKDLTACHLNGCPLRLADLLAADDFNLIHDVGGISGHIDRETGQLMDCFSPRFHA